MALRSPFLRRCGLAAIRRQYYGQKGLATASFLCGHGHKAIRKSGPKGLLFLASPGYRGPFVGWIGRAFLGYRLAKTATCSENAETGAFSTGEGSCCEIVISFFGCSCVDSHQ